MIGFIKRCLILPLLILSSGALVGQEKPTDKELPVNRWVKLPTQDASPGYSWSVPVFVPARGQVLHWGAVANHGQGNPGRNDVRAFDVGSRQWVSDYPSSASDVGIVGGGSGTALSYTGKGELHKDGTPRPAMVVQGGCWDSKRDRLVYTMAELMAAYDPKTKRWETLPAKTVLNDRELPGGPPVYGVGTCYDPVNDEIVMFSHFTAKNTDLRHATGQITGHYGTLRFGFKDNSWRRVSDTFGADEVKKARQELIAVMAKISGAFDAVWLLRRQPDPAKTRDGVKILDAVAVEVERLDMPASAKTALAKVPAQVKACRDALAGGKLDDVLILGRDILWVMNETLDGGLRVEPPPRCAVPMVYDPKRQVIVMFGGQNSLVRTDIDDPKLRGEFSMGLNDTWIYDCKTRQWRELPGKHRPTRQRLPLVAYDPKSEQVVLVTLHAGKPAKAALWTLDIEKGEWSKRDEQDWPGPVHWVGHTQGSTPNQMLALDEKSGLLLVTQPEGPKQAQATYALRLDLKALPTEFAPAFVPAPRIAPHAIPAADPDLVAKLKKLPVNTWVQAKPPRGPAPRDWGNLAVDPIRGWVVYFGGGHSTYQVSDVDVYVPGANRWTTGVGRHNDNIPIVGWEGSTLGLGGEARTGHLRNQYVAFDGRMFRFAGTSARSSFAAGGANAEFTDPKVVMFHDIDRGGVWREQLIEEIDKSPKDAPDSHNQTQMIDPAGRILDIQQVPVGYYDWRVARTFFRSYDINENRLTVKEIPKPFPMRNGESRTFCFVPDRQQILWCEYNHHEKKNADGFKRTWVYDIKDNKFIDLKPKHDLPGLPCVIEYCPEQKAALAIIPIGGKDEHWVYSFKKNDWGKLAVEVEGGTIRFQKPYGQMVYVRTYGVFVNVPHSGTQLLRPDFTKVKWRD